MEILVFWLALAFVVAIAAGARGRSGAGWFVISVIFSPLIGLILVLVLPNLRQERIVAEVIANQYAAKRDDPSFGVKRTTVTIDRSKPFEPDGVFAGIPYRVTRDGSIEAIMQGSLVRFADYDKFISANGGQI
jgi:hypothetical protein